MKNRYIKFAVIALVIALVIPQMALAAWWNPFSWSIWAHLKLPNSSKVQVAPKIIGGAKDSHGCLVAAGYSWCQTKNKCLRTWEEKCERPVVDQTASWKTYTDTKFNYQIQYPDKEIDTIGQNVPGREILSFGVNSTSSAIIQVTVTTADFISKYLFGGGPEHSPCFLDNSDYNYSKGVGKIQHSTNVVINDIVFRKGDVTTYFKDMNSQRNSPVIEYCASNGNRTVYVLDILYDTNQANSAVLDKMISTFRFTNTENISDLKTFSDSRIPFEFKYYSSMGGYYVTDNKYDLVSFFTSNFYLHYLNYYSDEKNNPGLDLGFNSIKNFDEVIKTIDSRELNQNVNKKEFKIDGRDAIEYDISAANSMVFVDNNTGFLYFGIAPNTKDGPVVLKDIIQTIKFK